MLLLRKQQYRSKDTEMPEHPTLHHADDAFHCGVSQAAYSVRTYSVHHPWHRSFVTRTRECLLYCTEFSSEDGANGQIGGFLDVGTARWDCQAVHVILSRQ